MAEELQFVAETAAEDQQGQDLDEEVLYQLATGLKSDVPIFSGPSDVAVPAAVSVYSGSPSLKPDGQPTRLAVRDPRSLRLHQQLCIYRL